MGKNHFQAYSGKCALHKKERAYDTVTKQPTPNIHFPRITKGLRHSQRAANTKHSLLQNHKRTHEFHLVALILKFGNYAG
jgi:hypothetical protein